MELKIALEGTSATRASEALAGLDGVEARAEAPSGEPRKDLVDLATVVTILGLVKTALEIAQAIKELFEKRKAADPTLKGTVQLPDGTRLDLEDATVEELARGLRALPERDA